MRTKVLCLALVLTNLISFGALAQDGEGDPGPGTVTVFSEDGENFTLYLNEDRKNASASSRVVASNVVEVPITFRIVFEKGEIPQITKRGIRQGTNCIYSIQKNKKGERVLRVRGCSNDPATDVATPESAPEASSPVPAPSPAVVEAPAQLKASFKDGVIAINDGRTLTVKKVKANGMSYPRLFMNIPEGAKVTIKYDDNDETYSAQVPLKYEVKDFSNNNAYFTLTVDEGGPTKTWSVKLQNANGYDLRIE